MITDEQADWLTQTLYTNGWARVMKPAIAQRADSAINALCKPPSERDGDCKGMSDDALRTRIVECKYILFAFEQEVTVNRMNRQREELSRQDNGGRVASTEANPVSP